MKISFMLFLIVIITTTSAHTVSVNRQSNITIDPPKTDVSILPESIPPVFIDHIDSFPHYHQRSSAFGGFEYGGRVYCGPVSVSNSLIRMYNLGHRRILDSSNDPGLDQFRLIKLLGSPEYFNTGNTGTSPGAICTGLKRFFRDRQVENYEIKYQGWRSVPPEFIEKGDSGIPDLSTILHSLHETWGVIVNFGWYKYDEENDVYTRNGGHWVTLTGYGHDSKEKNSSSLIFRDPARRNKMNSYINIRRINSGTLAGDFNGLPHSAEGFYIFRHSRYRFGIIDGAVMFRLALPHTEQMAAK